MVVLVVEDDEVSAQAARSILEALGCKVDIASNGVEAIELFEAHSYTLVLMDWQMPIMNGVEATARIRRMLRGRITPIIGTTSQMALTECQRMGMDDRISKPFTPENLKSVLTKWIC
jgi:CheY-like chemotaxis protein